MDTLDRFDVIQRRNTEEPLPLKSTNQWEKHIPEDLRLAYKDYKLIYRTSYYLVLSAKASEDKKSHFIRVLDTTSNIYKNQRDRVISLFLKEMFYLGMQLGTMIIERISFSNGKLAFVTEPDIAFFENEKQGPSACHSKDLLDDLIKNVLKDLSFLKAKLNFSDYSKLSESGMIRCHERRCVLTDWSGLPTQVNDRRYSENLFVQLSKEEQISEHLKEFARNILRVTCDVPTNHLEHLKALESDTIPKLYQLKLTDIFDKIDLPVFTKTFLTIVLKKKGINTLDISNLQEQIEKEISKKSLSSFQIPHDTIEVGEGKMERSKSEIVANKLTNELSTKGAVSIVSKKMNPLKMAQLGDNEFESTETKVESISTNPSSRKFSVNNIKLDASTIITQEVVSDASQIKKVRKKNDLKATYIEPLLEDNQENFEELKQAEKASSPLSLNSCLIPDYLSSDSHVKLAWTIYGSNRIGTYDSENPAIPQFEDLDTTIEKLPGTDCVILGVFNSLNSAFGIYQNVADKLVKIHMQQESRGYIPDIACSEKRMLIALNTVYKQTSYHLYDLKKNLTLKAQWQSTNQSNIESLSFDPQGERIVTMDSSAVVHISSVDSNESASVPKVIELKGNSSWLNRCRWNHSTNAIAVKYDDHRLTLIDPEKTNQLNSPFLLQPPSSNGVAWIEWSPDGNLLAVGGQDFISVIDVRESNNSTPTLLQPMEGIVYSVKWSSSGGFLASACEDGTISLIPWGSKKSVADHWKEPNAQVSSICFL